MKKITLLPLLLFVLLFTACNTSSSKKNTVETNEKGFVILTDDQIDNIIRRAYQYVALYNVNNKFAITQGGWNTLHADTKLKDHTMKDIARPNNDSFYTGIMLDLRKDAYVVNLPKFNSKYVSLMVTAYDHYVYVPKSTRQGDFQKDEKIVFYSKHTENYHGESVAGIDNVFEANGDFISVIFRVMPHANEPERFKKVVEQIGQISMQSLSEFQGKEPIPANEITFPEVGKTDLDIFENNFLEVMQFIFNHITFDENDEMDRELLACFAPLGIAPGETYNPKTDLKIDGKKFRQHAEKIHTENLNKLSDPGMSASLGPRVFKPKGQTDLEAILAVSIIGPIGLPIEEAFYPTVNTADGSQMNAMNDYVIKMTKDELPPAQAFWSLTLYDKANGFFIPNEWKKYSVGENAGMKLNDQGGIEIYVSAEKPIDVPIENWLPINRSDEDLDVILRVYVPELDKLSSWKVPVANKL
nr:DUF1214 domain-containing protein [uncultured Carboxylicivirga sp.]